MGDMVGGDGERPDRATDVFPDALSDLLDDAMASMGTETARNVVAKFNAVFGRLNVTKKGDMLFVLVVPGKQKYEAMKASDYPDKLLTVEITEYVEEYSATVEEMLAEIGVESEGPLATQDAAYVSNWQRDHYSDDDDDEGVD